MVPDKITVDEPLISTDVDSLIRTIAERKRVPLNDLRQICKIDKKTMDKWIAVLEDEGYITVEYGLRGTNVLWRDMQAPAQNEYRAAAPSDYAPEPPTPPAPPEAAPAEEIPAKVASEEPSRPPEDGGNPEFSHEAPLDEEPEPEDLLSAYLSKKKEGGADIDSIKSSILTSLEDDKSESQEEPVFAEPDEPDGETPNDSEADSGPEPEEAVSEPEEAPPRSVFPKEIIRPVERERAADVRELMDSYMKEINEEKSRIESLKKEREALYREKFVTMEGKMQADIVVLTEKIIEKESRIAQLKERVLELPDKVGELGRLQEQMDALRKEGRDALQRMRAKADGFLVGVGESRSEIEEKIAEVDSILSEQEGRVQGLEKLSASLDARSGKLRAALEEARAQLEEVSGAMASLADDLAQVDGMKAEIESMTDSIRQTVSTHGEELQSLEQELEGIERVEHWVQEYVRDYEQKVEDIEGYVDKSGEELDELREAAESLYMRKYLGELESITESYSNELHDAVSREKGIEMKIAESRTRITDLVTESQEMIKKLRSDAPETTGKDFGVLVAKVKARTTRAKNILAEKQQERQKLADDSRKTRKTASLPGRPKAQAKKKAVAKAAKKKRK